MAKLIVSKNGSVRIIPKASDLKKSKDPLPLSEEQKPKASSFEAGMSLRMLDDLDAALKRVKASSFETMPIHLLQSTMSNIYWKNLVNWTGSKKEFTDLFYRTFRGPISVLKEAGKMPELIGSNVMEEFPNLTLEDKIKSLDRSHRVVLKDSEGNKIISGTELLNWPEVAIVNVNSQDTVVVNVNDIVSVEHEGDHYVLTYAGNSLNKPEDKKVADSIDTAVAEADEMERISYVNKQVKRLISLMPEWDYMMLKVSDQPAKPVNNPRAKLDLDLVRFLIYSERGRGTAIPVWVIDLDKEPIEDIQEHPTGEWIIRTHKQLVIIAPMERSQSSRNVMSIEPVMSSEVSGESTEDKIERELFGEEVNI